jgi:RNA polymerase sigma factor (sigma-70 family)
MSQSIEHLLRELTPQVLGVVARRYGDFAAAEEAVQEASLAAAMQWPREGLPDNPRAWLTQTAMRRMVDHIRSESARRRRESEVAVEATRAHDAALGEPTTEHDDTLTLLFMCCHPTLTPASAIALTLRAVGGLTTAEIARAFLVPEATMAQRISRAKQTIKTSGIPFALPTAQERAERLRSVLHVLYLIFNEGYISTSGPHLRRSDLSNEAIRITRMLYALQPNDAEVAGLLALMLLTDARRLARTGPRGELIPLAQQDRSLWDRRQIEEGIALLSATLPTGAIGPYQLQAAIAALHDEAVRPEDTDWPQILALYGLLKRMSDNPIVSLNHAVAAAMVHGPARGLALLDVLEADARLAQQHRLHAVRAHLLEMAGDRDGAIQQAKQIACRSATISSSKLRVFAAIYNADSARDALSNTEHWRLIMRVAALYDIHGNLPALEAVLHDAREAGVDQVVVGGDVVPGPMPRETLALLLNLDMPVRFICGNGELAMLAQMAATDPDAVTYWGTVSGGPPSEQFREVYRWTARQLTPDYEPVLASWPRTLQIEIDGLGHVLFCHSTPHSETEVFTYLTAEDRLAPRFEGLQASVVVCGHTHMQFDRMIGDTRVVNAGSVGAPFGEPGAYWLLLGPDVQLRRTPYDLAQTAERIRATSYPLAQADAESILNPPDAQEMVALYGKWELQ